MPPTEDEPAPDCGIKDARQGSYWLKAVHVWTAALMLLCAGALFLYFGNIERTMPYPYHADEGFISGPASSILVKGNLHPPRFNYPSLPTHIAATAMAFGFLRGAAHLEIRSVDQIGEVGYPHYETPRVMQTARQAFAFLSALCLGMTGLCAWMTFKKPATMVLAPLVLFASPLYHRHSWVYLNVDIVGTSLVMLTVAACLAGIRHVSVRRSAILPGALAGLAAGSKYTLAIAILPALVAIGVSFPRARLITAWAAAVTVMVIAFLAAVPYSLIDIPGFLNGLGYETFHYASGHAGFADDPGWPQVVYYSRHFLSEFGYVASALAVLGLVLLPFADWRRAAVVTIFPVALLWLLISQRVHFTRNALAIQPFVAMFAAYGLVTLHGWIVDTAARRAWVPRAVPVAAVAGVMLVVATVPVWSLANNLRVRTDSRNLARAWVAKELPYDFAIVVPRELGFDRRGLEIGGRRVKFVNLREARDPGQVEALLSDVPSPAVLMVPRWGADRRSPGRTTADALNALSGQWRAMKSFGTNDVLVNYTYATAWGDPAFGIAKVK